MPLVEFKSKFDLFQKLVAIVGNGHPFTNFQEGYVGAQENYKPRLREHARSLLSLNTWHADEIGKGDILARTIQAIEIQDSQLNLTNNLVLWQNRYGHANRYHHIFLDAGYDPKLTKLLEQLLFDLYIGNGDEGYIFDRLNMETKGKYALLAYLFFLKDITRFMPIQPTSFDRAFRELQIDFTTLRKCSWDNYLKYNANLALIRSQIEAISSLKTVSLIDAHTFCWVFTKLKTQEEKGELTIGTPRRASGRIVSGREKSLIAMRISIEQTISNSNGQLTDQRIKNKELMMTNPELEKLLNDLLVNQEDRCALTGIQFDHHSPNGNKNLFPSPDRIDSNGHYEKGNLQIVCRFINFWKRASDNEDFKKLLMLVRGLDSDGMAQ